jgi:regulator of sirC expression with transglutaminase-like and TPR domain
MTQTELNAAIRLLDDPDKQVYGIVMDKLFSQGTEIIPPLSEALSSKEATPLMRSRIESILSKLELGDITENLKVWQKDDSDLLKGFWYCSRLKHFTLSLEEAESQVSELFAYYSGCDLDNFTDTERIRIVNHIIFNKLKFRTTTSDEYFNPDYCFLPDVLKTRTANPVTMGLIYTLFARGIGLRVFGVNLPKIYILTLCDKKFSPLFYINPSNNGAVFSSMEINRFINQNNIKHNNRFFSPCLNQTTILRLLNHLEYSYKMKKMFSKASCVTNLIKTFNSQLDRETDWL